MRKQSSDQRKTKRSALSPPDNKMQNQNDVGGFLTHVEGVDYAVLDELIGYAIRRSQLVIYEDFTITVGDPAVTPQRFAMLVIVGANPGMQQVQIARVLGIARPGATTLLDFWEARECLERRRIEGDRRSFGIFLTAKGRRSLVRLENLVRAHDQKILDVFSKTESRQLFSLLEKLTRKIKSC